MFIVIVSALIGAKMRKQMFDCTMFASAKEAKSGTCLAS